MTPFLRYAKARIENDKREFAYRFYMSDCLGHLVGIKTRYADLINEGVEETRTPEEIIGGISEKLANIGGE